MSAYELALLDWLACACAGARERAAMAVRGLGDDLLGEVAFASTAGHVLDFDDTFSEGVAHVSAACAPVALVLAARLDQTLESALSAYAEGFEAMAAFAAASHPALYEAGWHPTAVCGPVGAATAACHLLGVSPSEREHAVALALLRAGGTRGAFGTDGKAIQVGLAAAAGVQAALLAQAGARVDARAIHGPLGFEAVVGARFVGLRSPERLPRAIDRNWVKLHPSCLGTHSPIEAAAQAQAAGHVLEVEPVEVVVHPRARQAAHLDTVVDGLEAKFSIAYCVAHTFRQRAPTVEDFRAIDPATNDLARRVRVEVDASLPEFGAVLRSGATELTRVPVPSGSPQRPATSEQLERKVRDLVGERLTGVLDDLGRPAGEVLDAAGLRASDPAVRS